MVNKEPWALYPHMRIVFLMTPHVDLECTLAWSGIGSERSELARKRGSDLLSEISVFHPYRGMY